MPLHCGLISLRVQTPRKRKTAQRNRRVETRASDPEPLRKKNAARKHNNTPLSTRATIEAAPFRVKLFPSVTGLLNPKSSEFRFFFCCYIIYASLYVPGPWHFFHPVERIFIFLQISFFWDGFLSFQIEENLEKKKVVHTLTLYRSTHRSSICALPKK